MTIDTLRRALEELTVAAEGMPRETTAGGGATTLHHFNIPAFAVWNNDRQAVVWRILHGLAWKHIAIRKATQSEGGR